MRSRTPGGRERRRKAAAAAAWLRRRSITDSSRSERDHRISHQQSSRARRRSSRSCRREAAGRFVEGRSRRRSRPSAGESWPLRPISHPKCRRGDRGCSKLLRLRLFRHVLRPSSALWPARFSTIRHADKPPEWRRKRTSLEGPRMGKTVKIDEAYRPSDEEPFMNERQREYYRRKLTNWKNEILREAQDTLVALQTESENHPDLADRASSETDRAIELRARDRQRKLIAKINAAIARIDDGTYGYCEVTGEPISLRRLEARPIATMSIEAQEWHEKNERVHRDD